MPEIRDVKPLPLGSLKIGESQARLHQTEKGIDELAASIKAVGLLEPIVVCPGAEDGQYEIVAGQRRFLAHERLERPTIMAAILGEPVTGLDAKTLSATENIVRNELPRVDVVDIFVELYHRYGSIAAVSQKTGLERSRLEKYIKYDRLVPALKKMVIEKKVKLDAALRAQDAASVSGSTNVAEAIEFAQQMQEMPNIARNSVVKVRKQKPGLSPDEAVEEAKSGGQIAQFLVSMTTTQHALLKTYAQDEDTSVGTAARDLIVDGLSAKGYDPDAS